MGFQTYIFCSKVLSKCRKCRFRDPNFKMGFQTYIFCSKVPSKCRKFRFRDPNFKNLSGVACPRTPLQLCRHYGLPLTKILATLLTVLMIYFSIQIILRTSPYYVWASTYKQVLRRRRVYVCDSGWLPRGDECPIRKTF